MRNIKKIIICLTILLGSLTPGLVFAGSASSNLACQGVGVISGDSSCVSYNSSSHKLNSTLRTFVNIFSAIIGIIAVVMVMIGGVKYITSNGNPEKTSSAKDTILYAVIGIVVVALAQIIIAFVLRKA